MKLTGFRIQNFKGIKDAQVRFGENDLGRVHTLVGLNESGKTTLLEAMHTYNPDRETQLVVRSAKSLHEQREQAVPRDKIANFTGEILVTGFITADTQDWAKVREELAHEYELVLAESFTPKEFSMSLVHAYENGNHVETNWRLSQNCQIRTKKQKKLRAPDSDEVEYLCNIIRDRLPTIAYYPTFVFDFPKRIYLTHRDKSPRNNFYKRLFQDILDYDGSGYTIEKNILARLHREESHAFWPIWFPSFQGTSEEEKVKQVIARAESAVTRLVFSKWNEVFGENAGAKEIKIDLNYEQGEVVKNKDGTETQPTKHDAWIQFRIKDGPNAFSVDDRSLGFRWFFSFLLFTQFRIHRDLKRPTIFLFDEPASNLHAAAQKKLLESFPAIAKHPHRLFYSTHSHYMVEPKWLEQAYIVFDSQSRPDGSIIETSTQADSVVDVKVVPYRAFIQSKPAQVSYFQPILDTLEVRPSSFDYQTGGLIVEGKSDYYFIRFAATVTGQDLGPIFPANGSGTMGALVSLHRGWGLPVRILFDSDRGGKDGQKALKRDLALGDTQFVELASLNAETKRIEDMFSDDDQAALVGTATGNRKTVLLRTIQEHLAASTVPALSEESLERMRRLVERLKSFIEAER